MTSTARHPACAPVFTPPWEPPDPVDGCGLLIDEYFHGDGLDLDRMSGLARLKMLADLERMRGWVDAYQARVLADMVEDPSWLPITDDPAQREEFLHDEVAMLLHQSAPVVRTRIQVATDLARRFPALLDRLETGTCSWTQARRLVEACRHLGDADAAAVFDRVAARIGTQTPAQFTRTVRAAVLDLDPADRAVREARAAADRTVACRQLADGMSRLEVLLPTVDAATVMAALDRGADAYGPADPRRPGQRHADALTDLAAAALAGAGRSDDAARAGSGARAARPPVTVTVSVALSTLLGLDREHGDLDGFGPVPPEVARDLAAATNAQWRFLVTDDGGQALTLGTTTYRPSRSLRDWVITRDLTCRAPGCTAPARRCDLDHRNPYDRTGQGDGGPTSAPNLDALCEHHHRMKHARGFRNRREPDGTMTWQTPSGLVHAKPPDDRPLDTTYRHLPGDPPPF